MEELLTSKYRALYRAMIEKDGEMLDMLLADNFVLVHMTGMRQNKREFVRAVCDGTLNYFSEDMRASDITLRESEADFTGRSIVSAAVFGGGKHTWNLQLDIKFVLNDGDWLISKAVASTW